MIIVKDGENFSKVYGTSWFIIGFSGKGDGRKDDGRKRIGGSL